MSEAQEDRGWQSLRFERLGRAYHDGRGVSAAFSGGAWMRVDGVLAFVDSDGNEGEVVDVPVPDFDLRFVADRTFWVQSGEEGTIYTVGEDSIVPVEDVPEPPAVDRIETPRPVIDIAVSSAGYVGLDEDQVMFHFDPETQEVLAEWQIKRPLGVTSLEFTGDGGTLVATAEDSVVFFSFDPEGLGHDLYNYAEGGGSTGSSQGGSPASAGSASAGGGGGSYGDCL